MSAPQYLVRMSCVVTKLVTCENCTEEQAAQQPWNFCTDEQEIDMQDWTVLSVEREEVLPSVQTLLRQVRKQAALIILEIHVELG